MQSRILGILDPNYIRSDVAEDILAKKKLLELNPNANPWKIIR